MLFESVQDVLTELYLCDPERPLGEVAQQLPQPRAASFSRLYRTCARAPRSRSTLRWKRASDKALICNPEEIQKQSWTALQPSLWCLEP